MRGRPDADWQLQVFADGPVKSLAALRGLGFDAILLDTHGYDDGGKAAVADLTAALGKPQLTSASGRWLLWDIRPWAAAHRAHQRRGPRRGQAPGGRRHRPRAREPALAENPARARPTPAFRVDLRSPQ